MYMIVIYSAEYTLSLLFILQNTHYHCYLFCRIHKMIVIYSAEYTSWLLFILQNI